jgi:hypothetical protein
MRLPSIRRPVLHASYATVALGLLLAGCGSAGSAGKTASNPSTAAAATTATPSVPAPARISILAPGRGQHTGQTVTVRVRVTGAAAGGSSAFRYLLDNRESRRGSAQLTFDELAAGRHELVVALAHDAGVSARSFFVVRAPKPVVVAEPAHVSTMTTTTPAAPPPSPPGSGESPPPRQASTPAPPPPSSGGIPQGNGGDGDADNNGGPSDGDGNV